VAEIEDETPAGEEARRRAGAYLAAHGRAEFNIPGVTFGGRYDGSPAIVPDGTLPPADAADVYVPSACPGGRPPHLWLPEGASLYDRFGFEWTLLRMGKPRGEAFLGGALEVTAVDIPQARDLYEADLALIRPDQVVAWRGSTDADAASILARLAGHGAPG